MTALDDHWCASVPMTPGNCHEYSCCNALDVAREHLFFYGAHWKRCKKVTAWVQLPLPIPLHPLSLTAPLERALIKPMAPWFMEMLDNSSVLWYQLPLEIPKPQCDNVTKWRMPSSRIPLPTPTMFLQYQWYKSNKLSVPRTGQTRMWSKPGKRRIIWGSRFPKPTKITYPLLHQKSNYFNLMCSICLCTRQEHCFFASLNI